MIDDPLNWRVWRYILNDDDFIDVYGADIDPPGEEFPCACYMYENGVFITMCDDVALRMFFSLSEYDI